MSATPNLDRPMRITTFADVLGVQRRTEYLSLGIFINAIACATHADSKERLPLLKLASFGDWRTPRNSLRSDRNLLEIEGIELDSDSGKLTPEAAAATLHEAKLAGVVLTTSSHTPEHPRIRILLPLSNPLPPKMRSALVSRAAGLFEAQMAPESWTASQAYFFGTVNGQPDMQAIKVDGVDYDCIDERDDLDSAAKDKNGSTSKGNGAGPDPWFDLGDKAGGEPIDVEDCLRRIREGGQGTHTALLSLGGLWARDGLTEPLILRHLRRALEARPETARGSNWDRHVSGLPSLVAHCVTKENERRAHAGEPLIGAPDPWAAQPQTQAPELPPLPPEPEWPDPIERTAYRGILGEIVDATLPTTEGDRNAILIQHLVFFGNAIGISDTTPWAYGGKSVHRTNLFTIAIGRTAYARKGTATAEVEYFYRHANHEWLMRHVKSGLSSGEGIINLVRDEEAHIDGKTNELVIDVPGSTTKNVLIVESEFSRPLIAIQRSGNTLGDVLKQAWDGKTLGVLTKAKTTATEYLISIIAHGTFAALVDHLSTTMTQDGFANRFLFSCVQREQDQPNPPSIDGEAFAGFVAGLQSAIAATQYVGEMRKTKKGEAVWEDLYRLLGEERSGLYGAAISRGQPQVLRMAMLFALLEQRREIDAEHFMAAMAVWRFCAASAFYLFGERQVDAFNERVLRRLAQAPEGLTRTELHAAFGRHIDADQRDSALVQLLRDGLVTREMRAPQGRWVETWLYKERQR